MTSQLNARFKFISVTNDLDQVSNKKLIDEYEAFLKNYGGEAIQDFNDESVLPVFIVVMNGGTENKILDLWKKADQQNSFKPFYLLAHSGNNSLPAALEIFARLKNEDVRGKIIYLGEKPDKDYIEDLELAIKHLSIYNKLRKTRIGLIGKPSDWLVASMPDPSIIKKVWGPDVISIDMKELEILIDEVKDEEIDESLSGFTMRAAETKEPTKKEIKQTVRVYAAINKLVGKDNLSAVTVRCFDLVTDLKTTGCFALAKLNDDGIIAGCEGDLVSTLGMIWANLMTDQSIWMANPAQINEQNNSLWLAHCTTPLNMVQTYKLRSHFESGLGVGIQGEFSKGKVTLLRLGGKGLEKIWISNGEILESGNEENLCRTQVNVKLHGSAKPEDLLTNPLGNHLLLMRGSYTKELHNWWELFVG